MRVSSDGGAKRLRKREKKTWEEDYCLLSLPRGQWRVADSREEDKKDGQEEEGEEGVTRGGRGEWEEEEKKRREKREEIVSLDDLTIKSRIQLASLHSLTRSLTTPSRFDHLHHLFFFFVLAVNHREKNLSSLFPINIKTSPKTQKK